MSQWTLELRTTFISSSIHAVFFHYHNYYSTAVETSGLQIFEMCSTIFVFSKLTEILQNLYKCHFIKKIKSVLKSEIFVYFLYKRKVDHSTASSWYFLSHALNINNQRRLSSRLSILMFSGTLCNILLLSDNNINIDTHDDINFCEYTPLLQ